MDIEIYAFFERAALMVQARIEGGAATRRNLDLQLEIEVLLARLYL